jgi:hypothetical protein
MIRKFNFAPMHDTWSIIGSIFNLINNYKDNLLNLIKEKNIGHIIKESVKYIKSTIIEFHNQEIIRLIDL